MKKNKIIKTFIDGREWDVEFDPKVAGGWFSGKENYIKIGMKNTTNQEMSQIIIHELLEAICTTRSTRYKLPYDSDDNGHFLFAFNHLQFEQIVNDLYLAIKPFLKTFEKKDKQNRKHF